MDEIFAKKVRAAAVAGWWTVLIIDRLLHSADSMVCLFNDHPQTTGSDALLMGRRRHLAGNSLYLVVGNGDLQAWRRHDDICRHLADALGEKIGKKINMAYNAVFSLSFINARNIFVISYDGR